MIQNRELKQQARERLEACPQEKKIGLFYGGSLLAISIIYLLADLLISRLTPQAGGLSTIGVRSFMSALSSILPVVTFLLSMCLSFGYMGGMVRISRGQYASPNALRTGFERFWPLLRLTFFKGLITLGFSMGAFYLATVIFTLSPFSNRLVQALEPMVSGGSLLSEGTLELTDGVIDAVNASMLPLMAIFLIVAAVFVVPLLYRLRMTDYVLYDHPEAGALYAIRESKKMMRFHRLSVFKLDLSFWWFYLALALSYALNYAPMFLSVSGISLPVEGEALSVLCFLLSCAAEFVVIYFLRSRMEVTCALAYNRLKPKEQSTGAVLGNIFQM